MASEADRSEWKAARLDAERAKHLAYAMHMGQEDKSGRPYIVHVQEAVDYYKVRCAEADTFLLGLAYHHGLAAAWLHDVAEDTSMTPDMLIGLDFSREVVRLVDLLTRTDEVPSEDYYARIAADPIARLVKAADMDSNTRPGRLSMLDEKTQRRLRAKYAKGYELIGMTPRWK